MLLYLKQLMEQLLLLLQDDEVDEVEYLQEQSVESLLEQLIELIRHLLFLNSLSLLIAY
jgi:hypothetical protein